MDERRQQNIDNLERLISVEERIIALVDKFDSHEKLDEDRFEKNLNYIKEMEVRFNKRFDEIMIVIRQTNRTVQILWDEKNKRDGAIGMSKFIAASMGGLLVAFVDWMIKK